jgi:hypothetical protein
MMHWYGREVLFCKVPCLPYSANVREHVGSTAILSSLPYEIDTQSATVKPPSLSAYTAS